MSIFLRKNYCNLSNATTCLKSDLENELGDSRFRIFVFSLSLFLSLIHTHIHSQQQQQHTHIHTRTPSPHLLPLSHMLTIHIPILFRYLSYLHSLYLMYHT